MSKNDKKLDSKAQGEKQHLVDEHLENNIMKNLKVN